MPAARDNARRAFRPLFATLAEGSRERERDRTLPYAEFRLLAEAGFGTLRIPREEGGFGLDLPEFFALLVELAEADSNIAHAWRGHFEFLETRLSAAPEVRRFWIERAVTHREVIGNAWTERRDSADAQTQTRVRRDASGALTLSGLKHYSTGTLYADWVDVLADVEGSLRSVAVPTSDPGVTRLDDWDGFGQVLTGTGTTIFENVGVDPLLVEGVDFFEATERYERSIFQLVLLAVVIGIARRALAEVTAYIAGRTTPIFGGDGGSAPREDPLVQLDVGRGYARVFAAEATLERAAAALEDARVAAAAGGHESEAALRASRESRYATYAAQVVIIPQALEVTAGILDAVGASATSRELGFDRHWRNVRTVSTHNSLRHRERGLGEYHLTGRLTTMGALTPPDAAAARGAADTRGTEGPADEAGEGIAVGGGGGGAENSPPTPIGR